MNINQPEESVKLPADVKKAIEKARNRVTLLDADAQRLAVLKNTLNKEIIARNSQLTEMDGFIKTKEKAIEIVKIEVTKITKEFTEVEKVVKSTREEIAEEKEELSIERDKVKSAYTENHERAKGLDKREEAILKLEQNLEKREQEYEVKAAKLKEALS